MRTNPTPHVAQDGSTEDVMFKAFFVMIGVAVAGFFIAIIIDSVKRRRARNGG